MAGQDMEIRVDAEVVDYSGAGHLYVTALSCVGSRGKFPFMLIAAWCSLVLCPWAFQSPDGRCNIQCNFAAEMAKKSFVLMEEFEFPPRSNKQVNITNGSLVHGSAFMSASPYSTADTDMSMASRLKSAQSLYSSTFGTINSRPRSAYCSSIATPSPMADSE